MPDIHICRPNNPRFLARVRRPGHRIYQRVGKERKTLKAAIVALANAFDPTKHHRGDVLMVTHDWYDPVQLVEIVRK